MKRHGLSENGEMENGKPNRLNQ